MFYFAYGSNLNLDDLNRWCTEKGAKGDFLEFHDVGSLLNHELSFTLNSVTRNGGVLDVVPKNDIATTGVLFTVLHDRGWKLLDRKEGAPARYHRINVDIQTSCGKVVSAVTYAVNENLRQSFVRPSQHYVDVVLAGMAQWKMSDTQIRSALKG